MTHSYPINSRIQYFIVRGHEWPTLLHAVSQWLLDTNASVDAIHFAENPEAEEGAYIEAYVLHSSTYTVPCKDPSPIGPINEFVGSLKALIDEYKEKL